MDNAVLLSVCITTRNRAAYIRETLQNILTQCRAGIEVVVVDGASTDNTAEIVREIAARNPNLRLVRLSENSGLDADYDRAVSEARGTYCWLFSDDDLLADGAIDRVIEACRDEPVAIVVDASVLNEDFSELIAERRLPKDGPLRYSADEGEQFFRDCVTHLSFIGALIVRREFWLSRERSRYYGTEFIHCGVLFQSPLDGAVAIVREPVVRIRHGRGNWLKRWFEVWAVKWPRLLWSFQWINDSTRRAVQEPEPWARFAYLLGSRARRQYGWRQFSNVLVQESDSSMKLLAPLVCLAIPWWGAYAALAVRHRLASARALVRDRS